jgi:hypothetical protein
MDDKTAKELLSTVRKLEAQEEKAGFDFSDPLKGWKGWAPTTDAWAPTGSAGDSPRPYTPDVVHKLKEMGPQQLAKNRNNNIINALLLAGGGAAALRGGLGLSRMFSEDTQPVADRTVDMRVPVRDDEEDEKDAGDTLTDRIGELIPGMGPGDNPEATAESGAGYYLPSLLLGTPLAAYAGWKGVDALFNSQRKAKTKSRLERAKKEYEDSLRSSYKTASDNSSPVDCLDVAFDKLASGVFPNLPGQAKGLAATYALLSAPAAYMFVNDKMKKSSKRAILEKAMKERARRRAMTQPAELHAIPSALEEEEDN